MITEIIINFIYKSIPNIWNPLSFKQKTAPTDNYPYHPSN